MRPPGQGRAAAQSQKADDDQGCLALGPTALPISSPRGPVPSVDIGHSRSLRPSPGPGAFQTPLPWSVWAAAQGRFHRVFLVHPPHPAPSRAVGALPTVGQAWAFMLSLMPHIQATRKPNHITINRFSCPSQLPPWTKPLCPLPWLRAPPCFACTPPSLLSIWQPESSI